MHIVHAVIDGHEAQAVYVDGVLNENLSAEAADVASNGFQYRLDNDAHSSARTVAALASQVEVLEADFSWLQAQKFTWPEQLASVVRDDGDRTTWTERNSGLPDAQLAALSALRSSPEYEGANVDELPSAIESDGSVLVHVSGFREPLRYVRVHADGSIVDVQIEGDDGGITHAQRLAISIVRANPAVDFAADAEVVEDDGTITVYGTPTSSLEEDSHVRTTVTPVFYVARDGETRYSERIERDFDDTPEGRKMRRAIQEIYEDPDDEDGREL